MLPFRSLGKRRRNSLSLGRNERYHSRDAPPQSHTDTGHCVRTVFIVLLLLALRKRGYILRLFLGPTYGRRKLCWCDLWLLAFLKSLCVTPLAEASLRDLSCGIRRSIWGPCLTVLFSPRIPKNPSLHFSPSATTRRMLRVGERDVLKTSVRLSALRGKETERKKRNPSDSSFRRMISTLLVSLIHFFLSFLFSIC